MMLTIPRASAAASAVAVLALAGCGGHTDDPAPQPKLSACNYEGPTDGPGPGVAPHPSNEVRRLGVGCAEAAQLWAIGPAIAQEKKPVYSK